MSISDNIALISSIVTGIGFIASEILPFLPCEANGIIHSVVTCLSKLKQSDNSSINEKFSKEVEEILKISRTLDENLRIENEAVAEMKARLDEMYFERLL
jgi:hypothetical protein